MDDERFRDQREVSKYAIFCGIEATSRKYNLSPALLMSWVQNLDFDDLQLFAELRRIIREVIAKKGVKVAASEVGVSETLMELFAGGTDEPVKFTERKSETTQTPEFIAAKRIRTDSESQTADLLVEPAPAGPKKKFTTAEKLRGVKKIPSFSSEAEAAASIEVPLTKLQRWKKKVKTCLFQDMHVERLYGVHPREERDRFFFELDEALYKWWTSNQQPGNADQLLIEKARNIAKVDEQVPVVSPAWVSSFRAFYRI